MRILIFISLLTLCCCNKKETVAPTVASQLANIHTYDSLFLYEDASSVKYKLSEAIDIRPYWYKNKFDPTMGSEFALMEPIDLSKDTIIIVGHYGLEGYIVRY